MRKKVLIIGANGFTGRRVLDDLSRNIAYRVTGCSLHDDICPGSGDYHLYARTSVTTMRWKNCLKQCDPMS